MINFVNSEVDFKKIDRATPPVDPNLLIRYSVYMNDFFQLSLPRRIIRYVFDATAVLAQGFLFTFLKSNWDSLTMYFIGPIYCFYAIGLFVKHHDPDYMDGIRWLRHKCCACLIVFVILQSVLGAFAMGAICSTADEFLSDSFSAAITIIGLIVIFPLSLIAMVRLILKALNPATVIPELSPVRSVIYRTISDLGIWAVGCMMLSFLYTMAAQALDVQGKPTMHPAMAILFTFLMGLLFYFPSRFHLILEAHRDVSNWISFLVAIASLAFYLSW